MEYKTWVTLEHKKTGAEKEYQALVDFDAYVQPAQGRMADSREDAEGYCDVTIGGVQLLINEDKWIDADDLTSWDITTDIGEEIGDKLLAGEFDEEE